VRHETLQKKESKDLHLGEVDAVPFNDDGLFIFASELDMEWFALQIHEGLPLALLHKAQGGMEDPGQPLPAFLSEEQKKVNKSKNA